MINPLYDEELLAELLALQEQDPDKFMDLVMTVIKKHPEIVIADERDHEKKVLALAKIREHYADKEEYENCVLIRELEKKISEKA